MLFKAVAIILSTLFIAAVQISTADAGCRPGHGAKASYLKKAAHQSRARKAAQSRAAVAARQRKARQVQEARARKAQEKKNTIAESAAETPAEDVAETTAAGESTEKVATTGETCSRFIASAGTTVSVPCTTE